MKKILLVDDELNMLLVLEAMLEKEHYDVVTASDGLEALSVLERGDVAVVVTDLKMPRLDGLELLGRIQTHYPSIPVIIITAHGTVETAVDALKKGACDYITKPFDQDDLKNIIGKAFKTSALNDSEPASASDEEGHGDIIGSSRRMVEIYRLIRKVAPATTTVLIAGETGTGKELLARAIHMNSPRRNRPFIKINCAAIAENLMESELFGFEKGAFTGATHKRPGRFELAHRGTLFLDEIGDLPKDMQAKILRVIQEQEFERVGGLQTIKVDVRLVTATNRDLLQEVREGNFREDLYYRLNVLPINLPPLRERKDDIERLARYFLDSFNKKLGREIRQIDPQVMKLFTDYHWPGNIRELENLMERLVLLASGDTITPDNMPPEIQLSAMTGPDGSITESGETPRDILKSKTEELEKTMIMKILEECNLNISKAAQKLGFSRKGLQLKMIKYGLRKEPPR